MGEILLTVCCAAFNQERYIRDALDSFVAQKTDFPFEVLVHDDASTDGTAAIIREYGEKYPGLIVPMLEEENQYSRGVKIYNMMAPLAKGKYLAFCEGDDFWTDPRKLQKQVKFLEENPDYVLCVHNTLWHDQMTGKKHNMFSGEQRDLTLSDVIRGSHYHTSSMVCRKELRTEMPPFTTMIPQMVDYPLSIYGALTGKIRYFPEVMSTYRFMAVGSWSSRMEVDVDRAVRTQQAAIQMLEAADQWSGREYSEIFRLGVLSREYEIHSLRQEYKLMLDPVFAPLQTEADRRMVRLRKNFAWAFALKSRIYNKLLARRKA